MHNWEYKTVAIEYAYNDYELLAVAVNNKPLNPKERLDTYFTHIGQEGWELVGQSIATNGIMVCIFNPSCHVTNG